MRTFLWLVGLWQVNMKLLCHQMILIEICSAFWNDLTPIEIFHGNILLQLPKMPSCHPSCFFNGQPMKIMKKQVLESIVVANNVGLLREVALFLFVLSQEVGGREFCFADSTGHPQRHVSRTWKPFVDGKMVDGKINITFLLQLRCANQFLHWPGTQSLAPRFYK